MMTDEQRKTAQFTIRMNVIAADFAEALLLEDIAEEAVDCMTTTLLTLTKQYLSAARKAVMEVAE